MPKTNAKQQKQLQRKSSSKDTQNKESEIKAKILKERERVIDSIMCYSAELRLAAKALESENDQLVLLNHMTMVEPGERIKAFRQALRDKIMSYPAGLPDHLKK